MLQNFLLESQTEIEIQTRYKNYVENQIEKNFEISNKKEFLEKLRESGKGAIFYKKKELSKSFEINISKMLD